MPRRAPESAPIKDISPRPRRPRPTISAR